MTVVSLPARVWHGLTTYGFAVRHFRRNARLYLLSIAFIGPGMSTFGLLYNLYLLELGFNEALVGQVIAARSIGTMLGGFPAGMFYTRWGGRKSFVYATIAMAVTWLGQLMVQTPLMLMIAALVAGAATALLLTAIHPFLADESERQERTYLFSMNSIIWTTSGAVGSIVGGYLPHWLGTILSLETLAVGQRVSMIAGSVFILLGLIPILAMRPGRRESKVDVVEVAPGDNGHQSSRSAFVGGGIVVFFVGLALGTTLPFYNVYFRQFHQAGTEQVGLILAFSRVAGLLTLLILPSLINRYGIVKVNLFFGGATAIFLLLLGLPLPLLLIVPIFLTAFAFSRSAPFYFTLIMEVVPPRQRGTQGSIRVTVNFMARALAGVVGGYLIVHTGYGGLFTLGAVGTIAAAVAAWAFFRRSPAAAPRTTRRSQES